MEKKQTICFVTIMFVKGERRRVVMLFGKEILETDRGKYITYGFPSAILKETKDLISSKAAFVFETHLEDVIVVSLEQRNFRELQAKYLSKGYLVKNTTLKTVQLLGSTLILTTSAHALLTEVDGDVRSIDVDI